MTGTTQRREPLHRTAAEQADEVEFLRVYGPWAPLAPADVAALLDGFTRPWWVVGGHAVEAATGYRREHEDTDVSILSVDVDAFVAHLAGRYDVWNNDGGRLHPLGGRFGRPLDGPDTQLWLRADATSPWVLDVPLTPSTHGEWTNKRLPGHTAAVDDVTWVSGDGIRYLRPEIVVAYKARLDRPKDRADLAATLPVLTPARRSWLRDAVAAQDPAHPWLRVIDA